MPVKNITELRAELCESFDKLKTDRAHLPVAVELSNTAGKIINSLRVQLEYYKIRREKAPVVLFLVERAK